MSGNIPCPKGGVKLSEALDNMQLAYNPITKQLHFVSPKVEKKGEITDDIDKLSKKSSFSDEGISVSTCEKSDNDSPKSTLHWGGSVGGHQRGKDGGSFSSTISSLSECSLGSAASKDDNCEDGVAENDSVKLKKKGISGFFSRGTISFPWKSSSNSNSNVSSQPKDHSPISWKIFTSKSHGNLSSKVTSDEGQIPVTPAPSVNSTPLHQHHKRQGSSASEIQFEDLVASSIALIQHDRPSNLPAKCTEEALRHKAEHARMVEAARRKVEREAAARHARVQESLKMEERLASQAREWTQSILPHWQTMKNSKRTLELWGSGLPSSIRGRVWQLAIDNRLQIKHELYQEFVQKAKLRLHEAQLRRKRLKINQKCCGCRQSQENLNTKSIKEKIDIPLENTDSNIEKDVVRENSSINDEKSINQENSFDNLGKVSIHQENLSDKLEKSFDSSSINIDKYQSSANSNLEANNKVEEWLGPDETKRLSKTDVSLDTKPHTGIPRNLSEQNLQSHLKETKVCCSKSNPNLVEYSDECSMELIQLDIARTFPHLCIFQPGGPYFDVLHELLAAYVCYRPDIGYVQGMSFIAAVLILNMEAPEAFVCFANLLDGPVLRAAFTRDGAMMQRLWKAYTLLLDHNLPCLSSRVAPELYLLEWLYTAFAKAMPLDAACRVWDVFLRDGDTALFHTALGILHLYQEELKEMDFIAAAQFLTKLPEDLSPEALFKSISSVSMSIDGMSFEELVSCCQIESSLNDDVTLNL